jgi:hypothetical protein
MRVNAEISSQIRTKVEQMSPTMKKKVLKQCSFPSIPLKKVTKDLWLLDNECNNHMTCNKELISSIDTSIKFEITLGDDSQVKSLRKGILSVLTKQDQKKDIHHVYYIPNLKKNLIGVGQLMEHEYDVLFKGSICLIQDKPPSRKLIAKIQLTKNKMFPLNLVSIFPSHMPKMHRTHMRLYYGIIGLFISLL